jgi:acyl carrier protein
MTEPEILQALTELIRDVLGEDWDEDVVIERQTSFADDLELESLELVDLAERMRKRFPGLDLASWLSNLELDALMRLTVGDLVDFLAARLGP